LTNDIRLITHNCSEKIKFYLTLNKKSSFYHVYKDCSFLARELNTLPLHRLIGCIQQIQQLSERSLLLVYSSRFIVDLKVYSNHRQ